MQLKYERPTNDDFLPGEYYIEKWGYNVDETLTVPYWLLD